MAAPFCVDFKTDEPERPLNSPHELGTCEAAVESDSIGDFAAIMSMT